MILRGSISSIHYAEFITVRVHVAKKRGSFTIESIFSPSPRFPDGLGWLDSFQVGDIVDLHCREDKLRLHKEWVDSETQKVFLRAPGTDLELVVSVDDKFPVS